MHRPNGLYVMDRNVFSAVYGEEVQREIASLVNVLAPVQTPRSVCDIPELLAEMEVLISAWGGPRLNGWWLRRCPNLRAVFYGAGTVAQVMTEEAWGRGIEITSAYAANAIPVAEYTLAMILLCLKDVWRSAYNMRLLRRLPDCYTALGAFDRTVGLVSLGAVGRAVASRLKSFDLNLLAYDPLLSGDEANGLGISLVSLNDLFRQSDVVSVHAPHLKETEGLIRGVHLAMMKPGATFINTSRGMLVQEDELIDIASRRVDLQIVLDVTRRTPPDVCSPLYSLPNVLLTPHIAGARGDECRRLGRYMAEEIARYVNGEPLKWRITPELARNSSHRPT